MIKPQALTLKVHPMLYINKGQIRLKMEYYWHIWPDAAQSSISSLDTVYKRLGGSVGVDIFHLAAPFPDTIPRKTTVTLLLLTWQMLRLVTFLPS